MKKLHFSADYVNLVILQVILMDKSVCSINFSYLYLEAFLS